MGGSVEKLFYLPEAHTDFMFAVLAEELGFVGVATVMAMFTCILVRAFIIGRTAAILENYFSALVAQGIGVWLGFQAFINMGVNMGVLPTKGLTLPLMSFGGSSIVVTCIALAVLLRVDWENRQKNDVSPMNNYFFSFKRLTSQLYIYEKPALAGFSNPSLSHASSSGTSSRLGTRCLAKN